LTPATPGDATDSSPLLPRKKFRFAEINRKNLVRAKPAANEMKFDEEMMCNSLI
jgi:hypothetical protein